MDKFQALNELAREVYKNAVDHGFYDAELEMNDVVSGDLDKSIALQHFVFGQRIALIHSELSEALEADRNSRYARNVGTVKIALERNTSYESVFRAAIKDSVEDEIADALIRILDLCAARNIDIGTHVRLKMAYNSGRSRKHGKEY